MHKSTLIKAKRVQELVALHYEEGRQDRCKLWVYRHHVKPLYGICESTFYYYLSLDVDSVNDVEKKEDTRQLKLFD